MRYIYPSLDPSSPAGLTLAVGLGAILIAAIALAIRHHRGGFDPETAERETTYLKRASVAVIGVLVLAVLILPA